MEKKSKRKRRFTDQDIYKRLIHWHSYDRLPWGLTPERVAKAKPDPRTGAQPLSTLARWGEYPQGIKFKHLILAGKGMPKCAERNWDDNLASFSRNTPLENAIRFGKFPTDTTKAKLLAAKTRYGSGWDMVLHQIKRFNNGDDPSPSEMLVSCF